MVPHLNYVIWSAYWIVSIDMSNCHYIWLNFNTKVSSIKITRLLSRYTDIGYIKNVLFLDSKWKKLKNV